MLQCSTKVASSLAIASWFVLTGCGSTEPPGCRVGADCVSGACDVRGRCVPVSTGDAGDGGSVDGRRDDAPGGDSVVGDVGDAPSTEAGGCRPDHDGKITAEEVPLGPGLRATFRIASNVDVSTAGTMVAGRRRWDLSAPLSGDSDVIVETKAIPPLWFGKDFSGASYATALSAASDLLGIFEPTTAAVLLDGVASPADGSTRTELKYATPIASLSFPLTVGASWKSTSNVTGQASGVPVAFTEAYAFDVDAEGDVVTPFATFPVLRVKAVLTRTVGLSVTVTRTYTFVTECFGPIAAIVSQSNEAQEEFSRAAEVRRLAP
ncbi:MAG: hypothetical protein NVS3B10_04210 [Polyangiales bacterium]